MKNDNWYCEIQAPPELHEHLEQIFNAISYKIRHADGWEAGYKYGLEKGNNIILCKDCKYWQDNNNGYPHEECRWREDETPNETDFCSNAERRTDEN